MTSNFIDDYRMSVAFASVTSIFCRVLFSWRHTRGGGVLKLACCCFRLHRAGDRVGHAAQDSDQARPRRVGLVQGHDHPRVAPAAEPHRARVREGTYMYAKNLLHQAGVREGTQGLQLTSFTHLPVLSRWREGAPWTTWCYLCSSASRKRLFALLMSTSCDVKSTDWLQW